MNNKWIVGGNEVHGWVVSKPCDYGGKSARTWVMRGSLVKVWYTREQAQRAADSYNKSESRVLPSRRTTPSN